MEENYYIMTFTSHYRALYIYERITKRNLFVKLITAPNKINISCTQAIRFKQSDLNYVQQEIQKCNIYPTAQYKVFMNGKNELYELVK